MAYVPLNEGGFTETVAKQRLQRLEAEEMRLTAAYKEASAIGDFDSGEDLAQRIANVRQDAAAVIAAYNQEVARNTPQYREPTEAERHARAPDAMTGDDALWTANKGMSKALELTPEEYNEQVEKYRGMKARGEIT